MDSNFKPLQNMKKALILILLSIFSATGYSQEQLVFNKQEFNLGDIQDFSPKSIQIEFYNQSQDTITFAPLPITKTIALQLEDNKILPLQTSKITLVYFSNLLGRFNEKVYLVTNKNQTIKLEIKGKILSFAKENITVNPVFDEFENLMVKSVSGDKDIQFVVIDETTMKAIPYSKILLHSVKTPNTYIGTANQLGVIVNRIPDGQYSVECLIDGYKKDINRTKIDEYNNTVLVIVSRNLEKKQDLKKIGLSKLEKLNETPVVIDSIVPAQKIEEVAIQTETPVENRKSRKDLNIILLIDVSSSMEKNNRIGTLKNNIKKLIDAYESDDRLTILTFNETVTPVFESNFISNKNELKNTIDHISVSGNTDGILAIDKAFGEMERNHMDNYHNMIILATDGKITSNSSEDKSINSKIQDMNIKGFLFSVIGFGTSQYDLMKLEKMSNLGGGLFLKIDNPNETSDSLLLDEIYKTLLRIKQ